MDRTLETIDRLLEQPCYVIDFLPEKVPKNSDGQFFEVESYLLNGKKHSEIKDRFANVILKLMCYYHVSVWQNGFIDRPEPEMIVEIIRNTAADRSDTLNILFPDEDALLVFDQDSLNLSLYHPDERMQALAEKIALSENLFFWRSESQ
ncbi:MAG: hypothetical protein NC420_09545 [Eubacterium sp.]|nr:hypothetical protein [Eubacterium sp.]